ncbi:phage major tail tube protein [Pigmentiphaga sp. CHJ604]|uniref:phage major tail tube protein n=1 Tax=Pigmentiphaga sp. CHJ604 TaxID=3081984 RepID=UPI0030CCDB47
MGMPSKLKNFNLYNDGQSYMGEVESVVLPKLSRKLEPWRGGGMLGEVDADLGVEKLTVEWTAGGLLDTALKQWGLTTHGGATLRFAGAYQDDDDGAVRAVEVVVRGRHAEIDLGTAKAGDGTAHKYTTTCSYYKLTIDGEDIIEIDMINAVDKAGGVDRNAGIRKAIGLA